MSKTGAKALKELRRRLDRAYDRGSVSIVLRTSLVRALVNDAGAPDELSIAVVVQPYTRLGNNTPALEAWEVGYPDDKIKAHGGDNASIQWAVDQLVLRAAKRLIKVEVKTHEVKGVSHLPTDRPEPG